MRRDCQCKVLALEPASRLQQAEKPPVVSTLAIDENVVHRRVILDERLCLGGREDGQRFKSECAPQGAEERSGQNHIPQENRSGQRGDAPSGGLNFPESQH